MAKQNGGGGNNYKPLKNPELIGKGEKKSLAELAKEKSPTFKKEAENFHQMEQRREKPRELPKTFVQQHRPEKDKSKEKDLDKDR